MFNTSDFNLTESDTFYYEVKSYRPGEIFLPKIEIYYPDQIPILVIVNSTPPLPLNFQLKNNSATNYSLTYEGLEESMYKICLNISDKEMIWPTTYTINLTSRSD